MKRSRPWTVLLAVLVMHGAPLPSGRGQSFAPPPSRPPDAATRRAIEAKTARLTRLLTSLRKQGVPDTFLVEIEVFHKAASWIVRHDEFFEADSPSWTLEALDRGLLRGALVAQGALRDAPWLHARGQEEVRAFRSKIDDSVQPYAVILPADYGKDPGRRWRLDVVLHGRDVTLNEVKFLHQHNGQRKVEDVDRVRLHVFGRGNNGYRWAGETDVFEALDAFLGVERGLGRDRHLDLSRVVLRGFSMGGAGTWHLGLHFPDRWCVLAPGAGFTATHGYVPALPSKLPPWQERCLRIYDAADCAANLFNVPAVAYAGDRDPQRQAAENIAARLKEVAFPFQLKILTAPGLGHQFPPEWRGKVEAACVPFVARGRPEYPPRVRFVTYTLRYPACDWVEILALERHFDESLVDAERTEAGYTVRTKNVRTFHLTMAPGAPATVELLVDGQQVRARPWPGGDGAVRIYLDRAEGRWTSVLPQRLLTRAARQPRKASRLQGPIDDAFMGSFLCVRPTGQPWHPAVGHFADASLERFQKEWSKHWRGELAIKDDVDVTNEDIAQRHLVLFGDPASNCILSQSLAGLPLKWTKDRLELGGKVYPAADHVPALIYPSPLNPGRYVVLNSGHTFHRAEYDATNALLFARLGDFAVLRIAGERGPLAAEVVTAGLFDDAWQVAGGKGP